MSANVLEQLASDYSKVESREIKIDGVNTPLFVRPLNMEDNWTVAAIHQEESPAKRARLQASFLVKTVVDSEGNRAFKNCHGKPAAEVLSKMVSPKIVRAIFEEVITGLVSEDELEELEGKSEKQGSDS